MKSKGNKMVDYKDMIELVAAKISDDNDWGLDMGHPSWPQSVARINAILNQPNIAERSAAVWNRMILDSRDGDEAMALEIAQSVLEV